MTQNANDINNYNAEFHELQQHLRGVRDLKFNSTNVFVTEGRDIQMLSTEAESREIPRSTGCMFPVMPDNRL